MKKKTICDLVELAKSNINDEDKLIEILDSIKERADAMEARLLIYCNAIEDLGFFREGRNYDMM